MACEENILSLTGRTALSTTLLSWFAEERRDLPWRDSDDLYGTWVSEIMLQQTTVQTVIPYWRRFMARFPSVASLAAADEASVLAVWAGLGYYSRARNLHRAARLICTEHGGQLPDSFAGWFSLPGVGAYAAGAIASMGLGEVVPALDANARRVLCRWGVTDPAAFADLTESRRQRLVTALGTQLVPTTEPGRWNEALMELGALVCKAREAQCEQCPVARYCRAALGGWVAMIPPPKTRLAIEPVWTGLGLITWRNRVLLKPSPLAPLPNCWPERKIARQDFSSLHGGLWGVPMAPWLQGQEAPEMEHRPWQTEAGLPAKLWPARGLVRCLGEFRHAITRYRLRVSVYHLPLAAHEELPAAWWGFWPASGDVGADGRFFSLTDECPPLSALAEKALQFYRDSAV